MKVEIGIPDKESGWGREILPGWKQKIADYFSMGNRLAEYIYDFSDNWQHIIKLEKILPRDKSVDYPICIAGKRACPLEDCGGIWEGIKSYASPKFTTQTSFIRKTEEKYLKLKEIVDSYMRKVPEVRDYCERCLQTKRWFGSVVLMVVDAGFTSIGLNYFKTVVPKVEKFKREFVNTGKIMTLEDLAAADANNEELERIWKNKRSWQVVKSIASYLAKLEREKKLSDREAFIQWAKHSELEKWEKDAMGKMNGVGINTFQYLRMMGGIDTVMPDKVVKKVIGEILSKARIEMPANDIDFVRLVEQVARETGYKAIELCWMTWLIQSEAGISRIEKYREILPKI
jgi:hypothetical protein